MKLTKIFSLLLFSLSGFVVSAQTLGWKTETVNGYTYRYVDGDPMKARFYTLKNGLSVILSENHMRPRVAVNIAVRAGSNTDPGDHTGLAHYLEHLLFKGTDKIGTMNWAKEKPYIDAITGLYEKYGATKNEGQRKKIYQEIDRVSGLASRYSIANEYDNLMAEIGSEGSNAHTSAEETVYKENIPANAMDQFLAIQAERFRRPVFRLFHTELEAVYEEKNGSLDDDLGKMWDTLKINLFPTHNYGRQSTIGTIAHLKNPSLKAIRAYFDRYYVPNNMAVIMVGDFNPDELIKKIDAHFAYMRAKPLELYLPVAEKPIDKVIEKTIVGPSAESMLIGFRTPAADTHDQLVLSMIAKLLYNESAGLMDIHLNKAQIVQSSNAGFSQQKDHGVFILSANPKAGQSLAQLKPLLLGELAKIKSGDFDDALLKAIVANHKLDMLNGMDHDASRMTQLLNSFIVSKGENWDNQVAVIRELSKITKAEIQAVAGKYFGENYVLVNKKNGLGEKTQKVVKPAITPVSTNAGMTSAFVKKIAAMPVEGIKPSWLDYNKDMTKTRAGIADVFYIQNKENEVFNLYYRLDLGKWNAKSLEYAVAYLEFLGTDRLSADQISKAFYHIACSYGLYVSEEGAGISISGLQENFGKAVGLLDSILTNCKPDEQALAALKNRLLKARNDAKLDKGNISKGLLSYAQYGKNNPFNYVYTDQELHELRADDLTRELHGLLNYKHDIIYCGPLSVAQFRSEIVKHHHLPEAFLADPEKKTFSYAVQEKNQVLFADYDMVQSDIFWLRNLMPYRFSKAPAIAVFNDYFGLGMGSVVFQTIRESKALAYATYSKYVTPVKKENLFSQIAFVGCQADKTMESIKGMNELLNVLPVSQQRFDLARQAVKKGIETQRITRGGIVLSYLQGKKMGFETDIRKSLYESLDQLTMRDLQDLHGAELAGKPYTYCIVASEKKINTAELEKIGDLKKLSLEEIFGY